MKFWLLGISIRKKKTALFRSDVEPNQTFSGKKRGRFITQPCLHKKQVTYGFFGSLVSMNWKNIISKIILQVVWPNKDESNVENYGPDFK